MNFKRSPFSIQDKNAKDIGNEKDYPTLAGLIKDENIPSDDTNTVHHRRDLDSLG